MPYGERVRVTLFCSFCGVQFEGLMPNATTLAVRCMKHKTRPLPKGKRLQQMEEERKARNLRLGLTRYGEEEAVKEELREAAIDRLLLGGGRPKQVREVVEGRLVGETRKALGGVDVGGTLAERAKERELREGNRGLFLQFAEAFMPQVLNVLYEVAIDKEHRSWSEAVKLWMAYALGAAPREPTKVEGKVEHAHTVENVVAFRQWSPPGTMIEGEAKEVEE